MFDISKMAYDLYKQDWLDTHTTPEMRLQNIREYYDFVQECLSEHDLPGSYEDWLFENGIPRGGFYVCYEEFCDAEYRDPEYVRFLLNNDDALMKLYYQDIGKGGKPLDAQITSASTRTGTASNHHEAAKATDRGGERS